MNEEVDLVNLEYYIYEMSVSFFNVINVVESNKSERETECLLYNSLIYYIEKYFDY